MTLQQQVVQALKNMTYTVTPPSSNKGKEFTITVDPSEFNVDQILKIIDKARSSELRMIETAQQDYDKWSGFCMDDTSDFGNYIEQRIKELETPNQVEGEK